MAPPTSSSHPALPGKQGGGNHPLRTSSEALLGSSRELVIEHKGREYRLRVTQNGKLILTA